MDPMGISSVVWLLCDVVTQSPWELRSWKRMEVNEISFGSCESPMTGVAGAQPPPKTTPFANDLLLSFAKQNLSWWVRTSDFRSCPVFFNLTTSVWKFWDMVSRVICSCHSKKTPPVLYFWRVDASTKLEAQSAKSSRMGATHHSQWEVSVGILYGNGDIIHIHETLVDRVTETW